MRRQGGGGGRQGKERAHVKAFLFFVLPTTPFVKRHIARGVIGTANRFLRVI